MRTIHLRFWSFFLLLVLGCASGGCTYTTYEEEVQRETAEASSDAGTPPDASPDAELGDGDVFRDRGASGSKQLTRGSRQQTTILSETFYEMEKDGSSVSVASVYTLQFAIQATPAPAGSPVEPPTLTYAIITWSIGGNQITRKVSVSNGSSVTGVGAGCSVAVFDATGMAPAPVPPLTANDPVPNYNVLVTLTPGSRGESALPPVFYPIPANGTLPPNTGAHAPSVVIPVPPNSGATSVAVTTCNGADTPSDALVTQFFDDGGAGVVIKTYRPDIYTGFVALDPSATSILIQNQNMTQSLQWSVTFGIDG